MKDIEDGYKQSEAAYENILDLKPQEKTDSLDKQYAQSVKYLSDRNFSSAEATLKDLQTKIKTDQDKIAAAQAPTIVQTASNAPSSRDR